MRSKERLIWIISGFVLITVFVVIAFSPTAFAQSRSAESEEYLRTLREVFRFIENNYVDEVDAKKLFEGALKGMFDTLEDPNSYYLDKKALESLMDTTTGNFGGVGLIITKSTRDGGPASTDESNPAYVEVISPIDGTPAYRAGISAGDFITEIEGRSTRDMTIDQVVDTLRGEPGTIVQVTVLRGRNTVMNIDIQRDIIEIPTVKSAMIGKGIAYLKIIQFTPFTDDRIRDALRSFESDGYSSLIIDVRNNPGGLLQSVVEVADIFLPGGTIVGTRSRIPSENTVFTAVRRTDIAASVPIVVLINKGSASASEILAGALQDNERAVVIGQPSFGKGSVQQVQRTGFGGFKLTIARYYTPSGRYIDKKGIEPDRLIAEDELTEEQREAVNRLAAERVFAAFVKDRPAPTEAEILAFIRTLRADGVTLEDRVLRRLIRTEANRTNNNPPVFDLEFDTVLQEAVEMLKGGISRN